MTTRSVYRYEVPADDEWHWLDLSGDVVHVASRQRGVVEFWALWAAGSSTRRGFRVFGTGHQLPVTATYVGSALDGPFVWHLMEAP